MDLDPCLGGSRFHIEPNTRTYKDADTYIQTHFMLLREDYVDPVREGIKLCLRPPGNPRQRSAKDGRRTSLVCHHFVERERVSRR